MEVEYFRYVMHFTSIVKDNLKNLTVLDALKATPPRTVSIVLKIFSMQY